MGHCGLLSAFFVTFVLFVVILAGLHNYNLT
jgi:hypothetical protein